MTTRVVPISVLIVLSGCLLAILFFSQSLLTSKSSSVTRVVCSNGESQCTLNLHDQGYVTASLEPYPLQAQKKHRVSLVFNSLQPEGDVRVTIEGKDMYMGVSHYPLSRISRGRFEGNIVVPVCVIDADMLWLVSFNFVFQGGKHQVIFETAVIH